MHSYFPFLMHPYFPKTKHIYFPVTTDRFNKKTKFESGDD